MQSSIELLRMLKRIGPFTWKKLLDTIDFGECTKTQSHSSLKGFLERESNLLKMENSLIYNEIMQSCKDYEKAKEDMIMNISTEPPLSCFIIS